MLHFRNLLWLILVMLLLVQPVFAETTPSSDPTQQRDPDIISAVHRVSALPSNWSPLSPVSSQQQFLLGLTTAPVYSLSADGNWTPVLAAALPEDVTESYAGTYGIPAHATGGYAYRIALNSEACWDDGLVITADDYIFSIRKLLEDEENRDFWTFLANAQAILSGKPQLGDEIISLREAQLFNVHEALAAGYTQLYLDTSNFWGLDAGWLPISDRSRLQDFAMPDGMDERFVSPAYLYSRYLADGSESSRFQSRFLGVPKTTGNVMTMDDLGIVKTGPFEIVLLLQEPAVPSILMEKLEKLFLFRENYWSKDYATSPETYSGYGPYRITSVDSSQIILEPNSNWWGEPVTDEFDRILCRVSGKD